MPKYSVSDIVINWLMLSVFPCPEVITLSVVALREPVAVKSMVF